MKYEERAIVMEAAACALVGVLATSATAGETGVVVVVGGPQYRVGSHRQFVHLARCLAEHGYPTLRFDCRGMGDSEGAPPGFEAIAPDLDAAVTAVVVIKPGHTLSEHDVIQHCRGALAHFKAPKKVIFVDSLPKNPSGKLLKRELRRMFGG